jgi:hypothetical protein
MAISSTGKLLIAEEDDPAGPREYRGPAGRSQFTVGKYDVVAQPIPGATHMLRYTVSVAGRRIGATVSLPNESDCRYLEKPPVVPPLKPFHGTSRPGRPKKGSVPQRPVAPEIRQSISSEDLPSALSRPDASAGEDR